MRQRRLGDQGLVVSEMGLGCMEMSEFYGTGEEDESIATIHRAIDLGVTCLDTADQHRVDPEVPIEETVGSMKELVEAGEVPGPL